MSAAAERIAFPVRYAGEKLLALGKSEIAHVKALAKKSTAGLSVTRFGEALAAVA